MFKLLRLVHLPELLSFITDQRTANALLYFFKTTNMDVQIKRQYLIIYALKIVRLILIDIIITYLLGVIFYIFSNEFNKSDAEKTFLYDGEYDIRDERLNIQLVTFMYFTMTTLTTVGYGDYYPVSTIERIFIMLVQLIGVSFYSYIMGNFIDVLSSYEKKVGTADKESELEAWFLTLSKFNQNKPLDAETTEEIEDHFRYFWSESKLMSLSIDDNCLCNLPKQTQYFVTALI